MNERQRTMKRLAFRSRHMGTAENDHVFGLFADRHLAGLSDEGLAQYEALLAENDVVLYKWVTGKEPVPATHDTHVMVLLKSLSDGL